MKNARTLFLVLFLTACAHAPQQVEVVSGVRTVEPVRIPVLVPCVTVEQVPRPPATFMQPGMEGYKLELAAAIDLKSLDEYVIRTQSLLWGCVKSFD